MTEILIRKIPKDIKSWIDEQSLSHRTSANSFLLQVLRQAKANEANLADDTVERREPATNEIPFGVPFTFIDLFAGIGGLRIGLESVGGRCVFSSEIDPHAQKTYRAWFGELPVGDIRSVNIESIPDHDLLAAGFPCQPFSIAGVSKKNSLGRDHGFQDKTQGTLFFHLASVIEVKRPPVIMLENVKNLMSHDKGRTWEIIKETLVSLGYELHFEVINAADYVPQHRQRVFIVGFDRKVFRGRSGFSFPDPPHGRKPQFKDILEKSPDKKYTLTDQLWNYLQDYAERHRQKGNGFGFGLTSLDGVSRTLSARYYKDGSEVLIPNGRFNPRRMTPREAARLMGFPDKLKIVVSDTQAYKQFGNAVVPPVAKAIAKEISKVLSARIIRSNRCLIKK